MWELGQRSYHCSVSEHAILKDLNSFAYDPLESNGYHKNLKFHRNIICKNYDEASKKLEDMCDTYDDHAIFYKDGRKKYWLVGYSYHC